MANAGQSRIVRGACLGALGAIVSALFVLPAAPAAAQTVFRIGSSAPLPDRGSDLVLADIDGDGDLDQVVSYPGIPEVSIPSLAAVDVLRNDGSGRFSDPVRYAVPRAGFVAAGDLTGDGAADLVVAASGTTRLQVLVADGFGGLRPARSLEGAMSPGAVELADLDGDQILDLVLGSGPDAAVSVLLGRGDGTFGAPTNYPAGGAVGPIAAGDVDGDGIPDIVAGVLGRNQLRVLHGVGDGSLAAPIDAATVTNPRWLGLSDLNLDGALDAVVIDGPFGLLGSLLGDGSGRFGPPVRDTVGTQAANDAEAYDAAIADVDGDGRPDVLTSSVYSDIYNPAVQVRYGTGDGGLFERLPVSDHRTAQALAVGDVDADGDPDAVVLGVGRSQVVVNVAFATLPVRFDTPVRYPAGRDVGYTLTGDVNGDGQADVVTTGIGDSDGRPAVLLGDGRGALTRSALLTNELGQGALADVDADGDLDIVAHEYDAGHVRTMLNDGTGRFCPGPASLPGGVEAIAVADIDEDGLPDVLVTQDDGITVALGDGRGAFVPFGDPLLGDLYPRLPATGDFDEDGHLDLAAQTASAGLTILYGDGTGTFPRSADIDSGATYGAIEAADMTGDGHLDLVTGNVFVRGDGRGDFGPPVSDGDRNIAGFALADLDGDRKLDRVAAPESYPALALTVELGLGNGALQAPVDFLSGPDARSASVADFDGDGRPDVVVANVGAQSVSVLLNRTGPTARNLTVQQVVTATDIVPIGGSLSVTDTTVNVGDQTAGPSTTRYRLSRTPNLADGTSVPVTGQRSVPALGAGRASRGTSVVTVPTDLAEGSYYVLACADDGRVVGEADELNNCRLAAIAVRVGPGGPDLDVTSLSRNPATVIAGSTIRVQDTVTNAGNSGAGVSYTGAFLSADRVAGDDIVLPGHRMVPALRPGSASASTGIADYVVPIGVPPGSYYLVACADADNRVPETKESNNCFVTASVVTVLPAG